MLEGGDYMKFSTFYFSGTGNTKWVVEQLNNIVANNGHKAEMFSIDINDKLTDSIIKEILCDSDFIGFANPIYGAGMPPIMIRFINHLIDIQKNENTNTIGTYMVNTFGYVNAFGPIAAKKLLANTCFNLVAYVNIQLCNNISTPKLKSNKINKTKLNHRKERAKKELLLLTKRLLSGRNYITGIGPYLIPGIFIRLKVNKAIMDNYKTLSVNTQVCNRCMLCVNNCPTQSIKLKKDQFEFLSSCTSCMRCYNFCPKAAIVLGGTYANPNIYYRYRGPEIE